MSIISFAHAGSAGDILYSLTFARAYALSQDPNSLLVYYLQTGRPATHVEGHPYGNVLLSEDAANFLKPLLDYQWWLSCRVIPDADTDAFDLNAFRKLPLYFGAGDLRYHYYGLCDKLSPTGQELDKPCLDAPKDDRFKDKIIIFRSGRYHNPNVSYQPLKALRDDLVFIGLPREHQDFCNQVFPVTYHKAKDALEVASIMKGARCVIGNQTGLYAIAEQLKVPRILESCQLWQVNDKVMWGLPNVLPFGGRCRMAISDITPKMVESIAI